MSLVPFTRRIVTNRARDRAVGAAGPASTDGTEPKSAGPASASAPPGATVPDAGELEAAIAGAQAKLAQAAATNAMRYDPYQHVLTGLSGTLGAFLKSIWRWEEATKAVIAARHPLTEEERADLVLALVAATEKGAFEGTRKEAARMIRRLDHGLSVRIGLLVGGTFVAGSLLTLGVLLGASAGPFRPDVEAGAVWRDLVQNNPDPRAVLAAGEVRTDRNTGRRYYAGVSLWLDPSRPPPVTPPKPQEGQ
jgi:hypothetical protein